MHFWLLLKKKVNCLSPHPQVRCSIDGKIMGRRFAMHEIYNYTKQYRQMKSHLNLWSVVKHLAVPEIWKYMKEDTQVRSHLSASIVTRPLGRQEI